MLKTLLSFQGYRRPQGPAGPRFRTAGPVARLGRWLLAAGLGLLGTQGAQAQVLNYTPASAVNVAGTYTDLGTAGTTITTLNNDDASSAPQNIGFTFNFNGLAFTQFVLNTNGFIKLGAVAPSAASGQYNPLSSADPLDVNIIAPLANDLEGSATVPTEYRVSTSGPAGAQICTIQWKGVRDYSTTNPQFASEQFQARLFEGTNRIEFVYGTWTAGPAAALGRNHEVGIRGTTNASADRVQAAKPSSSSAWTTVTFANGTAGAVGPTYFLRNTFLPDAGRTFRFTPVVLPNNDAAVMQLYTQGQLATFNAPHVVRALVSNAGALAYTGTATLTVTRGATTLFTNTQPVTALAPGTATTVSFAPYDAATMANVGTNTVTVTLSNDDNNANNTKALDQVVSTTTVNYASPATATTLGLSFGATGTGNVGSRFTTTATRQVTSIQAYITNGTGTVTGILFNAAGTELGRSAIRTLVAADAGTLITFVLTTPVVVGAGDFFAGVNLTGGASLGAQIENPTRTVTFYQINTGPALVDLGPSNLGRLNLGAVTADPPACTVTNLTAANITQTTADLSFTGTAGSTYTVTYTPAGGSATTVTPAPTASPVALTGLTPGTTYAVSVTGNCSGGTTSTAATTSFTTLFPTPANDLCSGAIALTCGQTVTGTTNGATTTGDPTASCSTNTPSASPGVFYAFTGTGDIVTASTCGAATTIDTKLFVYSGTCGALTCVGSNDDDGTCTNTLASTVTFTSTAGTTYYFMVQRFGTGNTGNFGLSLTCVAPAPQSLTVTNGQNVTASGPYSTITVQSGGTLTLAGPTSATGAVQIQTGGVFITACQALTGAGSFELQTGAELRICDPAGIATSGATGAVQLSGTRTYAADASYTYNGTVAQLTGSGLPGTVRNLTVNNATGLSLSQGVSITQVARLTTGNLTTGGQAFTLLSSAAGTALIDNTGGTVAGTGTMQRAITSANPLGYRHYSTPVAQTAVSALGAPVTNPAYNTSPTPGTVSPFPTVFGYDESRVGTVTSNYGPFDQGWFSPASGSTLMLLNRGYTVNTGSSTTVSFTGTFNNAAQNSGSLSRGTDPQAGWQLLGNPYPSPLDWSSVTTAQMPGMDGSMYVFQSSGQYAGNYRSYQNGVGGPSPLIDAGSGYFARVTAPGTPGAVNLTNANRVTSFGAQPAFGRGLQDTRPQLHLQLAGAGLHDDAFLYLETGATTGLDAYFDATKLANPSGLDLASLAGNEALVINGLAPLTTTDVVAPLVLRVPQAGSFAFEVANLDNFGTATVYLRDALTGTQQVLTAGTRYAFTLATATAGNGRFSVVFRPATVTATATSLSPGTVSVYPNPAQSSFTLLLPPLAGQHEVHATLLNALGQVMLTRTIGLTAAGATASFDTHLLATGVYTLRLQAENQVMSSRVVIK